jgi:hypothetical protein
LALVPVRLVRVSLLLPLLLFLLLLPLLRQ